MSGQGSSSSSSGGVILNISGSGSGNSSSTGTGSSVLHAPQSLNSSSSYQPMECESSPRHSFNIGRRPTITSNMNTGTSITASMDAGNGCNSRGSSSNNNSALIQSSLSSYNSLILPNIPHLPMTSIHHHQQPNFYNYTGYNAGSENHRQVVVPAQVVVTGGKQRSDAEREDSPMVGVCVQQSPVAIH
jgi:dual specificity tyrosine-phosphorylation-regulated kinase 1